MTIKEEVKKEWAKGAKWVAPKWVDRIIDLTIQKTLEEVEEILKRNICCRTDNLMICLKKGTGVCVYGGELEGYCGGIPIVDIFKELKEMRKDEN